MVRPYSGIGHVPMAMAPKLFLPPGSFRVDPCENKGLPELLLSISELTLSGRPLASISEILSYMHAGRNAFRFFFLPAYARVFGKLG
jgi:hypothetical protein